MTTMIINVPRDGRKMKKKMNRKTSWDLIGTGFYGVCLLNKSENIDLSGLMSLSYIQADVSLTLLVWIWMEFGYQKIQLFFEETTNRKYNC